MLRWFARWLRESADLPRYILGTEVTWAKKISSGALAAEEVLTLFEHAQAILGHTPKTHLFVHDYAPGKKFRFLEFPLGVSSKAPKVSPDFTARSSALSVGIIEQDSGRSLKGSSLQAAIRENQIWEGDRFELKTLRRPYSQTDFTGFLSGVDVMLNTSLTETFSYEIRDAQFSGTPVPHPVSTYISKSKDVFVESWPEFARSFSSINHLVGILEAWSADSQALEEAGLNQKYWASFFFSENTLRKAFLRLFQRPDAFATEDSHVWLFCEHELARFRKEILRKRALGREEPLRRVVILGNCANSESSPETEQILTFFRGERGFSYWDSEARLVVHVGPFPFAGKERIIAVRHPKLGLVPRLIFDSAEGPELEDQKFWQLVSRVFATETVMERRCDWPSKQRLVGN